MVSFFAALNNRSATQPRLQIYQDNVVDLEGNPFGTLETTNLSDVYFPRVVRFLGAQNLYAFVGTSVYNSPDGGITWRVVLNPASIVSTDARRGIFVITLDGVAHLCIFWPVASNGVRLAKSTDGLTWTSTANMPGITLEVLNSPVVFAGKLYCAGLLNANSTKIFCFDFASMTLSSSATNNGISSAASDLCVFNNQLIMAGVNDADLSNLLIYEIDGVNSVELANLDTGVTLVDTNRLAVWTTNNSLYIAARQSGSGIELCRINSAFTTLTNITSTAVPATLQTNTAATINRALVDAPSSLTGANVYLYSRDTGDVWDIYRWNSTTEALTLLHNNVGSTAHSIYFNKTMDGSAYYEFLQPHAEILSFETGPDGVTISYKLYGPNNRVSGASFQLFYNTGRAGDVDNPVTLKDPNLGTVVFNSVTGITADNGITTYIVTWDTVADDVQNPSAFQLIGKIIINVPRRRRRRRKRWYKF
jgi:hypothetical protein